jgi:hypothetical protein
MIEMGKKYQTRDGRAVRILATDLRGPFPIVGAIAEGDGTEYPTMWTASGEWQGVGNDDYALIPVPTKHEGWIVVQRVEGGEKRLPFVTVFDTKGRAMEKMNEWFTPARHLSDVWVAHVAWED